MYIFGRVLICWFWCLFQAAAERGLTMRWIEDLADDFVRSGKRDHWFVGTDPLIAKVRLSNGFAVYVHLH